MKIKKGVYEKLLQSCPYAPPEIGGILGGQNNIVTDIVFDDCRVISNKAVYIPNIDFLNLKIEEWHKYEIEFYGIFHTHIEENTLSKDDESNIEKIMLSMPKSIDKLYFPVVIPKKEIVVYAAETANNKVNIYLDSVDII